MKILLNMRLINPCQLIRTRVATASHLKCYVRLLCASSTSFNKEIAVGKKDEFIQVGLERYKRDRWTNITPHLLRLIGTNLHLQERHPICLLKQRVVDCFYKHFVNKRGNPLFSVHDRLSPVVTVEQNFDQLLIPLDHPSRSTNDTYYVNERFVIRGHTSAHQWQLINSGLDNFLVVGDVYRRDSIDACHYPAFHQMEGVRLCTKHEVENMFGESLEVFPSVPQSRIPTHQENHSLIAAQVMEKDMKSFIEKLVANLFGAQTKMRWVDTYFPFTHPSWELEIFHQDEWLEVLGCGIMEHQLLQSAGAGDKIGWALGFGLDRLAMKLYSIPDIRIFWSKDTGFQSQFAGADFNSQITYKPVSIYPQCVNDISFWIPDDFTSSDFYDLIREIGGSLVEQVTLIDEFVHPNTKRTSHCYRIVYRHMERTLTQSEVNLIHKQIESNSVARLNVVIR